MDDYAGGQPLEAEELRAWLRRMSDEELRAFGETARHKCVVLMRRLWSWWRRKLAPVMLDDPGVAPMQATRYTGDPSCYKKHTPPFFWTIQNWGVNG